MPAPKRSDGAPWRNFYGRRHGKKLRPGQERHMAQTLPEVAIPGVSWDENPDRTALDLVALAKGRQQVWLEIGFGSGEHLAEIARQHPDTLMLGCEPFVNGVAALVPRIAELGLDNVRVHPGDARDLLDVIPDGALDRCYLLYPDPWPKKRHHRRRFVSRDNLDALARVLKPGAELRIATDIQDYVRHTLVHVARHDGFVWCANGPSDWRDPWPGWSRTRYEAKAIREGRKPHYLRLLHG